MSINQLAKRCYEDAYELGWYNPPKSNVETLAMVITEVCEAIDELRNHKVSVYCKKESLKPEGWGVEIADAVIRLLDFAGSQGLDLETIIEMKLEYNKTRGHRHGEKPF